MPGVEGTNDTITTTKEASRPPIVSREFWHPGTWKVLGDREQKSHIRENNKGGSRNKRRIFPSNISKQKRKGGFLNYLGRYSFFSDSL